MFNLRARPTQGSPLFIWTNANTLTAGSTVSDSWETYKQSSAYYLPFNYTRVTNNSLVTITFYPNQDLNQGIPIFAGSSTNIDADIIPGLWSFSIKNEDAATTITAGQIIVLSSKNPVVAK